MSKNANDGNAAGATAMASALVRFNAHVMGAMLALLAGAGLFLATVALLIQGGPLTGQMLALLSHFFPGYGISLGGAFVGGFWAAILGYAIGFIVGRAYGPWLLRGATHMLSGRDDGAPIAGVMELRPLPFATVSAALAAGALFLATNWLWLRYGGHPSPNLELLANYLPGYTSDVVGSVIGAFWLFLYTFVAAFGVAWVYDRVLDARSAH